MARSSQRLLRERRMQSEFSLTELLNAGVPVDSSEAVAIVLRLAPYASEHAFGSFPSLDDVYLTEDGIRLGNLDVAQPDTRSSVVWLARTLHALLAYSDAAQAGMPLGLQFLVSRASGHRFGYPGQPMDVGAFRPFASVAEFTHAAERFAPEDPDAAIRALYERARLIEWTA